MIWAGLAATAVVPYLAVWWLARHVRLVWRAAPPSAPRTAVLTVPVRPHGAVAESQRAALLAVRIIPGEAERGSIER